MLEPELSEEKRFHKGRGLRTRCNDCHAHAKGADRGPHANVPRPMCRTNLPRANVRQGAHLAPLAPLTGAAHARLNNEREREHRLRGAPRACSTQECDT